VAKFFSLRDVSFFSQSDIVTIISITDVPCHLYARVTAEVPRIHTKPMLRRGVAYSTDLRFCFVAYEDIEQLEPGDTTSHTFSKSSWPFCFTKYVYFWGYQDGEVCKSTSPFFMYHNGCQVCPLSLHQSFMEIWGIPRPAMHQAFLEPWSYYGAPLPPMHQVFLEPWTYTYIPPPAMHQAFLEPWTS